MKKNRAKKQISANSKKKSKEQTLTRYYVHGDETSDGLFYCKGCEDSFSVDHFKSAESGRSHILRYKQSFKAWTDIKKGGQFVGYFRPKDAANLLSKIKEPKLFESRFFKWTKKQTNRDDPIGTLAGDIHRDSGFPKSSDSYETIHNYISFKAKGDAETLCAFDEIWNEFKIARPGRDGISPKLRFEIFRRDRYSCQICGVKKTRENDIILEVDHILAVARGGSNEQANLQTTCLNCNRGKRTELI